MKLPEYFKKYAQCFPMHIKIWLQETYDLFYIKVPVIVTTVLPKDFLVEL